MWFIGPMVGLVVLTAGAPLAAAEPKPEVFGFTKVWPIHLSLSAKEYSALEPAAIGFPGFGGPPKTPKAPENPADRLASWSESTASIGTRASADSSGSLRRG